MRKVILITLGAVLLIVGIAYAVSPDALTGDPTIRKGMAYGETAAGNPVKMLVDTDGTLNIG